MDEKVYEFDVALSFAGEDRANAERLAKLLRESNVRVFYDEFVKATLWGRIYINIWKPYKRIRRNTALYSYQKLTLKRIGPSTN
jgi:hypothetical protein